jgi:hypothetical protein
MRPASRWIAGWKHLAIIALFPTFDNKTCLAV